MVPVDAGQVEDSGQIVRNALILASLTQQPCEIYDICGRGGKAGLQPVDMACVEAAKAICQAKVEGASVGSTEFYFEPGEVRAGDYFFGIGDGGPATLLLQTILIPLTRPDRSSSVTVLGGTHVPDSPSFHYLQEVWRYFMGRLGFHFEPTLTRAGFAPSGGGEVTVKVLPTRRLKTLTLLNRGHLKRVRALSLTSASLPEHVARRQGEAMAHELAIRGIEAEVVEERLDAPSEGMHSLIVGEFERSRAGYFALGQRGRRAESVGRDAAHEFLAFLDSDGVVDEHLADQLVLPLSLVRGKSVLRPSFITRAFKVNCEIVREFLPDARISPLGEGGSMKTVEIVGAGVL